MAKKTAKQNSGKADVSILKNPRITEKSANASAFSVYVFDVSVGATKPEVAKAFAQVYKHVPLKVNIVNIPRRSVFRRTKAGGNQLGFAARGRKAYVYLPKGTTIEVM